jgi:hypothetical protein
MSNINQHLFKKFLVILVASLLIVSGVLAEEGQFILNTDLIDIEIDQIQAIEIPPTAGEYQILPGNPGPNLPDDFAPLPDACDNAAGSYMSEGMNAARTTMIKFDDIIHDNKDEELVYYALYAIEANYFATTDTFFDNPNNLQPAGPFIDGDIVTIGSDSICLATDSYTFRLWEINTGEWAVESVTFTQAIDITDMWEGIPPPANMQNNIALPDYPVLVDGVVIRYMMPYVEPPITTLPGANNDQLTPNDALLTVCENTAPSYLSVGMDVMLNGYGYAKFPTTVGADWGNWSFNNTDVQLSNYGVGVYVDILNETPFVGIPGNLDSAIQTVDELYSGTFDSGKVVDGPFCTSMNAEPANDSNKTVEAPDPAHDRFYTWWKIEVNGEVGWYPENIGQYSHWLWDHDGMFNRKLELYYMVPFGAQQANCPTPNLYAGLVIEPASNAMNIRVAPNGDIMGRLDMGQSATIFGDPICDGGTNWWQSDRGGYLAETDPETRGILLMPYVPEPEPTREPVEPSDSTQPVDPTPIPATSNDSSDDDSTDNDNDDNDSTRPNTPPTVEIKVVTIQPTSTRPPRG